MGSVHLGLTRNTTLRKATQRPRRKTSLKLCSRNKTPSVAFYRNLAMKRVRSVQEEKKSQAI